MTSHITQVMPGVMICAVLEGTGGVICGIIRGAKITRGYNRERQARLYVVILGGHAGLMVVMPSLAAQFCMGVTEPDTPWLFLVPQALVCTVAHSNSNLFRIR
jgi:hypothetical protein